MAERDSGMKGIGGGGGIGGDFLADVWAHLPVLVVRLSTDGIVLGINPAVEKVTAYKAEEVLGKNWWGLMFPGKLFAQVPKFVSAARPDGGSAVLRDHPMVLRTKGGLERTIAWTRFARDAGDGRREIVCLGQDLTDRLLDAERAAVNRLMEDVLPGETATGQPEGLKISAADVNAVVNPDEVDGTFVLPLAVLPPVSGNGSAEAIEQVHGFLSEVETRMGDLERAFADGQVKVVGRLADELKIGAHACGLLNVSGAAEKVCHAVHVGSVEAVGLRVEELVELCRKARG